MNPEVNKLLFDIQDSINVIEKHLQNVSGLSTYKNDLKTIDAVERRLAIIGEALWKANKLNDQVAVSNKSKIIALRHILIHDYDLVEDETIWIICKSHLLQLKKEIHALLNTK